MYPESMLETLNRWLSTSSLTRSGRYEKQLALVDEVLAKLVPCPPWHPTAVTLAQLAEKHGIRDLPRVYLGPESWLAAQAIPGRDSIITGEVGPRTSLRPVAGAAAHELAHILREDRFLYPRQRKATEYATDRLAIQLLGAQEPMIDCVEIANGVNQAMIERAKPVAGDDFKSAFAKAYTMKQQLKIQSIAYGSYEERLANARATDASDQRHVVELVARRNARTDLPIAR